MKPLLLFFALSLFGLACDAKSPPAHPPQAIAAPSTPTEKPASTDWCNEHGVPESKCVLCHPDLIAKFKAAGDWCGEHDIPESACTICNPHVREEFAALRPAPAVLVAASAPARRTTVWPDKNDPQCPVEQATIRFRDAGMATRAGISIEPAQPRRISATLQCPAEIQVAPRRTARVATRAAGIVTEIRVEAGDAVKAGDVLAVVESAALGEAKNRYLELRENLKLAEADDTRATRLHDGVVMLLKAVQPEASGDELRVKLAAVAIGESKSRLLKAHAALRVARDSLARQERMRAQDATSEKSYLAAQSELNAAEAEYSALREEIALDSERNVQVAHRSRKIARAALDAAERHLHVLGLDDDQIAALDGQPAHTAPRFELRAPIDGRVLDRHAVVGEAVGEQAAVFTIADLSSMQLAITLSPADAACVHPGQSVLFSDIADEFSLQGRIQRVDTRVDPRSRAVIAYADLPNADGRLRANLFGQARIVLHGDEDVLSVPDEAVQTDGCCRVVFVRMADDRFCPRKVVVGTRAAGYAEILSGLSPGEQVVTAGSFLMKTEILKNNIGAGCCEVNPGR